MAKTKEVYAHRTKQDCTTQHTTALVNKPPNFIVNMNTTPTNVYRLAAIHHTIQPSGRVWGKLDLSVYIVLITFRLLQERGWGGGEFNLHSDTCADTQIMQKGKVYVCEEDISE